MDSDKINFDGLDGTQCEELLIKTFPKLYGRSIDDNRAFSMFGFETPPGWFKLVYDLSYMIDDYCKNNNVEYPYVSQVKSKYGSLRYYIDGGDDYIDKLIDIYEDKSYHVCETCGSEEDVTQNEKGWIFTLCKECRKELDKAK